MYSLQCIKIVFLLKLLDWRTQMTNHHYCPTQCPVLLWFRFIPYMAIECDLYSHGHKCESLRRVRLVDRRAVCATSAVQGIMSTKLIHIMSACWTSKRARGSVGAGFEDTYMPHMSNTENHRPVYNVIWHISHREHLPDLKMAS